MAMSMHDGGRQLSQQHNISGGAETEASLFLVQAGVGRQAAASDCAVTWDNNNKRLIHRGRKRSSYFKQKRLL